MAQLSTIAVADLVEDFDFYPRKDVDSLHVSNLFQALEAGEHLPPVIADRKSKRIVDGFHRCRAWSRFHGPSSSIPVELRSYKNDGELFIDAIRLNSNHGRRLTSIDVVRAATRAKAFGVDDVQISKALRMTVEKVGALVVDRTATTYARPKPKEDNEANGSAADDAFYVPLKRTIRHMAGERLTKEQEQVNDKLSGMAPLFYINQVIMLLQSKLMPTDDENINSALVELGKLIGEL
jgi:hypothetical protein